MTLFLLSAFLVMFSGAQPIYHPQNERFSKDCENVYQVLREFRRDIDELKHSIKQLQIREQGEDKSTVKTTINQQWVELCTTMDTTHTYHNI